MTKEIIIDGCNVAECRLLDDETNTMCNAFRCGCDNSGFHQPYCRQNPNCYFKQLQRLKKENEELKKQYNCYACNTCNGKEDYRNMKRHCENAIKTVQKYNSVLKEIREIAKHWLNNDWSCYHCRSNMDEKLEEIIKLTRF